MSFKNLLNLVPQIVTYHQAWAIIHGVSLETTLTHKRDGLLLWRDEKNAENSLHFIKNRPKKITAEQAMKQILGLESNQIKEVSNRLDIAINKLGFPPKEAYKEAMTGKRFCSIKKLLSKRNTNAVYAMLIAQENCNDFPNLPKEMAFCVAGFLKYDDGSNLNQALYEQKIAEQHNKENCDILR